MKQYNEYEDKLVSFDTAIKADIVGYTNRSNGYDVECFTCSEDTKIIFDNWSGLIPDDQKFLCHRPTITGLQKWLREEEDVLIYLKVSPHYKDPNDLSKKWMVIVNELFITDSDEYEEGLELGLSYALDEIVRNR